MTELKTRDKMLRDVISLPRLATEKGQSLWAGGVNVRLTDVDTPQMLARRTDEGLVFRFDVTPEPYIRRTYEYALTAKDDSWVALDLSQLVSEDVTITNDLIFVGVPLERFTLNEFMHGRNMVMAALHDAGRIANPSMYDVQGHRVDRNRDEIVEYFLKHPQKPDWLLMLDSDMEFPPTTGIRLTRWKKPVVGGLYFHRGDHRPLVFRDGGMAKNRWKQDVRMSEYMDDVVWQYLIEHQVPMRDGSIVVDGDDDGALVECYSLGTGAIVIHRSVLEALAPHIDRPISWFQYKDGTRSEDLEFCEMVQTELGLPIYADLSTMCGHYNMQPMGQSQFRQYIEARGISMSNYTSQDAGMWLAEDIGITPDIALQRLKDFKAAELAEHWNTFSVNGPESVEHFYADDKTGELYLYDLMRWNATPTFNLLRRMLLGWRGKQVLEIGAGIGSLAMQLLVQGNDILAVEPNPRLRAFMERRYQRALAAKVLPPIAGKMKIIETIKQVQGKYDLVVAMDVMEHIHVDELPHVVQQIGNHMKLNGRLFTHNNWYQQEMYPMHFNHEAIWEQTLVDAGLHMLDEFWAVKVSVGELVK